LKILFCGDKHLKITRFDLAKQCLSWLNGVIDEHKPDMYICLGDDMDGHSVLRSEIMSEFRKHIDHVMSLNIPTYYILGNHDMYKPKDSKYHAFQSMMGLYDNFKIVDHRIDLDCMTLVPYIPNHEEFPLDTKEICVAHQTFIGADYGYTRPEAGVDAARVRAKIIISGHVHIRQSFGKCYYPGTPYAQSVNDIDQAKGVMIFDTDTYQQTFIESPLPKWRGLKYEISPELSILDIHSDIASALTKGDHWVVEITGPRAEIVSYMDSKPYIKLQKDYDIRIRPNSTDKDKQKVQIEALSMEHIIKEYSDKVYNGNIDKKIIVDRALDILKKVRE